MILRMAVLERSPRRLVICDSFFGVRKNVVGLHNLLELVGGLLILWISVRVIAENQFPICTFNLIRAGLPFDSQKRVIVILVSQRRVLMISSGSRPL